MPNAAVKVDDLVIESGQTVSSETLGESLLRYARGVTLFSPDTLPETVTIEVTDDGTNWVTLQSGAVDIELPAGKATVVTVLSSRGLRLVAGGAVGADRTFGVMLSEA